MSGSNPDPRLPKWRNAYDGNPYHAYDEEGNPICGAKLRHKEGICHKPPTKGYKRCRLHGGVAPRGPNHPNFKHGNRTRHANLPDLATLAAEFFADPDYLSVAKEMALMRALLEQSKARMEELGDLGVNVDLARKGYQKIQDAMTNPNPEAAANQLQQGVAILGKALDDLNSEQALRDDIRETALTLTRLAQHEAVRKKLDGQYMPLPVFTFFLDTLRRAVRELNLDEKQTRRFEAVLHELLTQQPMLVMGVTSNADVETA